MSHAAIRMTASALTDVGRTREHNEDRYLVGDLTAGVASSEESEFACEVGPKGAILLVADGMGGASAGEVASRMATDLIFHQLATGWSADKDSSPRAFADHVRDSVEKANARIHERSRSQIELDGMGTTATLVGVLGSKLLVTQVGDSRAYLIRDRVATQLSRDQSYLQHLMDTEGLSEEEAEAMANSNVILQALGPHPSVDVVQSWEPVAHGDVVLLCSDGLSGMVRAEEIADAVDGGDDLTQVCRELVELANERGGPDNITVVAAQITGDGLATDEESEPAV